MALEPYETLGVARDATFADIKKAYRAKIRAAHPDRNPGDPFAATRAALINEAYDILSNVDRRRTYDAGDTHNPLAMQSAARQLIVDQFRALLAQAPPPSGDGIIREIGRNLSSELRKIKAAKSQGEAANKSLERMRKKFRRRREGGDDFLNEAIDGMQADNDRTFAEVEKARQAYTLALKILDDYEDAPEERTRSYSLLEFATNTSTY